MGSCFQFFNLLDFLINPAILVVPRMEPVIHQKSVHLEEGPVLDHVHQDLEFVVLVRKYFWFIIKDLKKLVTSLIFFTVTVGCGATINENCTYFEATGLGSGECRTMLCPCSNNICQMRLDFNTFVITGPSTNTNSETKILNGVVSSSAAKTANYASTCATDIFTITNAPNLPELCGTLTGEHGNIFTKKLYFFFHWCYSNNFSYLLPSLFWFWWWLPWFESKYWTKCNLCYRTI